MATVSESGATLRTESLTPLHWLGIALAVATGAIHLFLGASFVGDPMGWAFLVAAAGFFGGVAAVLVDYRRRLTYLLGIPFTAGQIPIWYAVNAPDLSALGVGDKVIQIVLVVVLAALYLRES